MVRKGLKSAVLCLLFAFIALKHCNAQNNNENRNQPATVRVELNSFEQEHLSKSETAAITENKSVRGRKMMVKDQMVREEDAKNGPLKISRTIHSRKELGHERKGEITTASKSSDKKVLAKNSNAVGLTAFSADYHMAKPHPPKNN